MAKVQQNRFKIGAYIRVSTEEQTLNPEGSMKNQEQRLREFIRNRNRDGNFGEITEVFSDPGISAKDMRRPSLQRLLTGIRLGEINLVIVTDLSRLTRSTKDFGTIWEYLREYKCGFLSLRENFDTTNAAGEMMIYTMATLAWISTEQNSPNIYAFFVPKISL